MNRFGKETLSRKTYNFFLEHWLLSSIITSLPLLYFIIFLIISDSGFQIIEKSFPISFAHVAFAFLLIVSFGFVILKNLADRYNDYTKQNGLMLFMLMQKSIEEVVSYKLNNLQSLLPKFFQNSKNISKAGFIDPKIQVKFLKDNIQKSLSQIFGAPKDAIGISIIYKLQNQDWEWFVTDNIENELTLKELTTNKNTTAFKLIKNSRLDHIFYPDKEKAIVDECYVPDRKDISNYNIGSIYCKKILFDFEKFSMLSILSVTTYGFRICDDDDDEAKYKFKDVIMSAFELRIKLELAQFAVLELIKKVKK